jgi:NAD(P)-dependent dehydrogenase (short-subunit alcohol dehydrogenase family)
LLPGGIAGTAEQVPSRFGTGSERVADGILFLAGDQSSNVNGAELVIDAGLSA